MWWLGKGDGEDTACLEPQTKLKGKVTILSLLEAAQQVGKGKAGNY